MGLNLCPYLKGLGYHPKNARNSVSAQDTDDVNQGCGVRLCMPRRAITTSNMSDDVASCAGYGTCLLGCRVYR